MTEHDHQKALIRICRAHEGRYPALRSIYAVPNGGDRNRIVAAKMRGEGQRAGVSDLHLPYPTDRAHGLFLEMKKPGGRVKQNQREWLELMADFGHGSVIAWGYEQGWQAIEDYLHGRLPIGRVVEYKERRAA